jgi:glycosyltransferase involved in cell wall biosynthesis
MNSLPLVLHVPFGYFPSPVGGTEVYVAALCRELQSLGVTNVIAAPGDSEACYHHESTDVFRFGVNSSYSPMNDEGDSMAALNFGALLDRLQPQIAHFHALSPAVSVLALREVKQRGIATVYTYHTPTGSCHRGTMMRWGTEPCDGRLTATRCAACQLHHLGVPKLAAQALAITSWATHTLAPGFPQKARWQIPLRASKLAQTRHRSIREWWAGMDRIVALCAWTERLLEANGVPRHQIRKVRHGLTQASPTAAAKHHSHNTGPVKLVFLGRLDPTKGLHLLLDALDLAPDLKLEIDVHTIIEGAPGAYARKLQQRLQTHPKVRVCPPVPSSEVISTLRGASALVVPSTWFETGPLVVLEAFAAGIPVVGSGFGGIAEWVTDGVDGLLVRDLKPGSWAAALRRLVAEPGLLAQLTAGVKAPRDMTAVAHEMLEIYQELAAERSLHARVASAPVTT